MSKTWSINGNTLKLNTDFVYNKDEFDINVIFTTVGKRDNYNNTPYGIKIMINRTEIRIIAVQDKSMMIQKPKGNGEMNPSMTLLDNYDGTVIQLMDDIFRKISAVVLGLREGKWKSMKPYYSPLEPGTPYDINRKNKFEEDNPGKTYKTFQGLNIGLWFDSKTKILTNPAKFVSLDGEISYLVNDQERLNHTKLEFYRENVGELVKGGFDIFSKVYGKTLNDLQRETPEELANRGSLIDADSVCGIYQNCKIKLIYIKLPLAVKSNSSREYSSASLGYTFISLAPSDNSLAVQHETGEEELANLIAQERKSMEQVADPNDFQLE